MARVYLKRGLLVQRLEANEIPEGLAVPEGHVAYREHDGEVRTMPAAVFAAHYHEPDPEYWERDRDDDEGRQEASDSRNDQGGA